MTLKRFIDVIGSALALLLLLPVMAIIALLVRIHLGQPIFFRQQRPGRHGKPFELIKFRTMRIEPGRDNDIGSDADRLTRLGRFLRSTSLDELPGLWNVLRGEMSLVGPRPLLMRYLDRYTPEQARRNLVKPGLTGWTQVNGRNAISWEEKFELDNYYVDHQSIWLDLKIMFITLAHLIRPSGISAEGSATMPEFMGSVERTPPAGDSPDRLLS